MAADSRRLHAPSFNQHGTWRAVVCVNIARDIARILANIAVPSLDHGVKEVHTRYMRGGKGGAQGRAVIGVAWTDTLTFVQHGGTVQTSSLPGKGVLSDSMYMP
jgi:hypothetical protein